MRRFSIIIKRGTTGRFSNLAQGREQQWCHLQPSRHGHSKIDLYSAARTSILTKLPAFLQPRNGTRQIRSFSLEAIPTILLPPVAFLGLFVTLWVYKCVMMILFQDKIIYMPYVPPFSRSEKIEDYAAGCKPVHWTTKHIRSLDGTKIALCIGTIPRISEPAVNAPKHVIICYFQGNGSSSPPRLPLLSEVLRLINLLQIEIKTDVKYTLIALSYRGYWTSSGRASQSGIELDAQALLKHVEEDYVLPDQEAEMILWGQSIGAGVATTATAGHLSKECAKTRLQIKALILETPFRNIRSMLSAIYPQKWLPYGYLWPFLWNHWDSDAALRKISGYENRPKILLLPATKDEIVPPTEADKLESLCQKLCLDTQRQDIAGALHTQATMRRAGQKAVAEFVVKTATTGCIGINR